LSLSPNLIPAKVNCLLRREASIPSGEWRRWRSRTLRISAATPRDVEGVTLGAALWVVNAYDGRPDATGIAKELLLPASVHSLKSEIRWIRGHRSAAFEAPPLGRLPGYIPQHCVIAANLNFSRTVHNYLYGALLPATRYAVSHGGPPLKVLRGQTAYQGKENHDR
jgi:hypothetical protein